MNDRCYTPLPIVLKSIGDPGGLPQSSRQTVRVEGQPGLESSLVNGNNIASPRITLDGHPLLSEVGKDALRYLRPDDRAEGFHVFSTKLEHSILGQRTCTDRPWSILNSFLKNLP
jgi:hypothetical protein